MTRSIDPEARFLYVAGNQLEQVVTETGAIPDDVSNVEPEHNDHQ